MSVQTYALFGAPLLTVAFAAVAFVAFRLWAIRSERAIEAMERELNAARQPSRGGEVSAGDMDDVLRSLGQALGREDAFNRPAGTPQRSA